MTFTPVISSHQLSFAQFQPVLICKVIKLVKASKQHLDPVLPSLHLPFSRTPTTNTQGNRRLQVHFLFSPGS